MSEEAVERLKEAVESAALAMLRESAAGIAFEVDFVSDQVEPIVANRVRSLQDGDPDLPPSAELKHLPATVSPPSG